MRNEDFECYRPGNGPINCIKEDEIADAAIAIEILRTKHLTLSERVSEEFMQVFGKLGGFDEKLSAIEIKLSRILEGIGIGSVRPIYPSLDWEIDEPTGVHGPGEWAERARSAAEKVGNLTNQMAAMQARLDERVRHSDRVREDALTTQKHKIQRLQIIAGILIAFASAIGALFTQWLMNG